MCALCNSMIKSILKKISSVNKLTCIQTSRSFLVIVDIPSLTFLRVVTQQMACGVDAVRKRKDLEVEAIVAPKKFKALEAVALVAT